MGSSKQKWTLVGFFPDKVFLIAYKLVFADLQNVDIIGFFLEAIPMVKPVEKPYSAETKEERHLWS